MTPADLSALSALEAKATKGPWTNNLETLCGRVWVEGPKHVAHFIAAPLFEMRGGEPGRAAADAQREADAAFIAAMRNATPSLLAHVAAQAERIEALEALLDSEHATLTKVRLRGVFNVDESMEASRSWRAAEDDLRARLLLGGKEGT